MDNTIIERDILNSSFRRNLIKFLSLLFYLLPFALISGPFLPDLIVSVMGIVFVFISIRSKLWHYYRNNISYLFFLFYFLILISSFQSSNIFLSLESSLFYFRFFLFICCIALLIKNNEKLIMYFSYSLFIAIVLLIIDGFIQFYFGSNLLNFSLNDGFRVSSFFGEDKKLGTFLMRIVPLTIALFILNKKINFTGLIVGCFTIFSVYLLIFLSGERGAIALSLLSLFLILIFLKAYFKFRLILFLTTAIMILTLMFSNNPYKSRVVDLTLSQMNSQPNAEQIYLISPHYYAIYNSTVKIFLDNSILGIGPKMYREICKEERYYLDDSCSTHPHNTYLQLLAETGVFPAILVFFIFLFFFSRLLLNGFYIYFNRRKIFMNDSQVCLYICIIVSLWPIAPHMNFFNNWVSILYYLPLGFLLRFEHNNKQVI